MSEREPAQAVIYCRVSDDKQVKLGDGLNSQETRCREFANARGYAVIEVFKDDMTGERASRPALDEMLTFIRKHRSKPLIVIIDNIDRLARDLNTHLALRIAIAKAGGDLKSPSIEFGDDADSRL